MTDASTSPSTRRESETVAVDIQLLGGFRVRVGDRTIADSEWRLQKARSLVKLLALSPDHRLPRDRVIDLLWPDLDPEAANNNLYQTLHSVRRAFGLPGSAKAIRLQHGVVALLPDGPLHLDVDEFERAAAVARRSDDVALYRSALALYGGELLPDDLYEDWAAWRREGLRETHLSLLLELARRHEARGELSAATDALNQAVLADPVCEEAHSELIRLYAATGQRGRATRQYRLMREVLAAELDVEPEDDQEIRRAILPESEPANRSAVLEELVGPVPHNLPVALTSFVGRRMELAEICEALSAARILTLTGVAGAGKTRLALRSAWDQLESFPDGVWLVPLASLSDPCLVPEHVGAILGVEDDDGRPSDERIIDRLVDRQTLLILDNCEHLIDACRALCVRLLSSCPQLRIIATSRSRLAIMGELTYSVVPLSLPPGDDVTPAAVAASEAAQLFVERARFRRPDFQIISGTARGVQAICSLVEGIPLALELAAARTGSLGVDQIAERLAESQQILSSSDEGLDTRHRSLPGALDWSYELLGDAEKSLFRQLAVFEGAFTLDAAEDLVGDAPLSVLDRLTTLVDTSLVNVEGTEEGTVRYRLLQPVRQYAWQRMARDGDQEMTRRQHALLVMNFAEAAAPELRSHDADAWIARIEQVHNDVRACLRWSFETEHIEVGMRVAAALWRFWYSRGYLREGRATTRRLLASGGEDVTIDAGVRAAAFNAGGAMAFYQTDYEEALTFYRRALSIRQEIGDEKGRAATLSNIGLILKDRGDFAGAAECFEQAIGIARRIEDRRGLASSLGNLGILYQEHGDNERARPLHEESLALSRELGDMPMTSLNNLGALAIAQEDWRAARAFLNESLELSIQVGVKRSEAVALLNLGHVDRAEGGVAEALHRYRAGLELAREIGEPALLALGLEGVAGSAADAGDALLAARLLAVADRLRQERHLPLNAVEVERVGAVRDKIRAALGHDFDSAYRAGQVLSPTEAVAAALDPVDA